MGEVRFRARPPASGDDEYDIAISDDGQAFTLRLSELQAVVDASASPDLVAARVFCVVLPVDHGVDISFRTNGIMSAMEGGSGYAVLSVNGTTQVSHLPSGTDEGFGQELRFQAAGPTSQCYLAVVVAQRDPAFPDTGATIGVSSVDGEIHPHRAGRFVLSGPDGQLPLQPGDQQRRGHRDQRELSEQGQRAQRDRVGATQRRRCRHRRPNRR
jgi:hypothetical protein